MIKTGVTLFLSTLLIHSAFAGGNGGNGGGAGGAAGSNGTAGAGALGGGGGGGNSISTTTPTAGNGGNGAGASPGIGGARGIIGAPDGANGANGAAGSGSGGGGGGNTTLISSPNSSQLTGGHGGNAGGTPGNAAGGAGGGDGAIITAPVSLSQPITGGRGGNGSSTGGGAGGGGAGVVFTPTSELMTNDTILTGGNGGQGFTTAGGGGAGGAGLVVNASNNTITNNKTITGGNAGSCDNNQGGTGGDGIRGLSTITNITNTAGATIEGGTGSGIGAGGTGIRVGRGSIINDGTIKGGNGGGISSAIATGSAAGAGMGGSAGYTPNVNPGGTGGVGILCTTNQSTVINSGTITPGAGQSDAIRFTTTSNILEIHGTSVINGNVTGSTSGTFRLGGDTNGSFDLDELGPKYQGFNAWQKRGLSTWTLTGTNTGTWTIVQGTLKIGNGGTSGDITGGLVNSGTVIFDRSDDLTYGGVISSFGDVEKRNTNELTLTATQSLTGIFTVSQGTLRIGNGGTVGFVTNTLVNNSKIIFDRSNTVSHTGAISGTGSVEKVGANTVRFTSDLTYTGGTTINAGVFQVGNNTTTGSLTGDVINNGTLTFFRSNDYTFAGNISGSGNFSKLGAGKLTLTGNLLSSGTKTISTGTLEIGDGSTSGSVSGNIANATGLIFNKSNTWTYSNVISGAGPFSHNGAGTTVFTGANTYTGVTTVNAGNMQINGSLNSTTTTINANGTLSGSGSVRNVVNNGTVQAGNSTPGTLGIIGTYTQTGQLNARINGNSQSDTLNITGAATLGGTLHIIPTGGNLPTSQTYTILNAANVIGTFASVTGSSSVFTYTPIYAANQVRVQITRIANVQSGYTGEDASAVGNYINSIPYSPSTSSLIDSLNALSPQNLTTALKELSASDSEQRATPLRCTDSSISGQPFSWSIVDRLNPTFSTQQIAALKEVLNTPLKLITLKGGKLKVTSERITASESAPFLPLFEKLKFGDTSLWIQGSASYFKLDNAILNSSVIQGYSGTNYTTTIGADNQITNNINLGILLGTGLQRAKGNISNDKSNASTIRFGVYGTLTIQDITHLFASVIISRHAVDGTRTMTIIPATAHRSYTAWGTSGFIELNRDFMINSKIAITPFMQASASNISEPEFTERNAGAQNLIIHGHHTLSIGKSAGAQVSSAFKTADRDYIAFIRAGITHYNIIPGNNKTTANLIGQSNTFTTVTPLKNQVTGTTKLGLSTAVTQSLKITGSYEGEYGSSLQKHQATLKLNLSF